MKKYIQAKTVDLSDESLQNKLLLANDSDTDSEILRQLYEMGDDMITKFVISNPNTPLDILEEYANSDNIDYAKLARNPNAPADILRQCADLGDNYTKALVGHNPNTPADVLRKLFKETSTTAWLKKVIAENPNAPADVKEAYEQYKLSIEEIKQRVSEYVKQVIYDGIVNVIHDLEQYALDNDTIAEKVPGYDPEWCSGEYTGDAEDMWESALNSLTAYEVYGLFEELHL